MQSKETEILVKKAKRRESNAFKELMQLYMKYIYRVALAILMDDNDVADAIQDTILTCWDKRVEIKNIVRLFIAAACTALITGAIA